VIAVHLLDDSYVQPEPGTTAADHLVSGLVPLAALLAFASAYPRLREGVRVLQQRPDIDRNRIGGIGLSVGGETLLQTAAAGTMLFSNQAAPPNLKNLVGRIAPRPVFFIYGQHDQDNVRELTPGYYVTAGEPKAIWEVAGAAHTRGIDAQPREYGGIAPRQRFA
jgi:poly(3-hydroxybutyrate) depolymerase